jgi:hypothetical protein
VATQITFRGWQRPAVGALIQTVEGSRARIATTVELRIEDADGDTRSDSASLAAFLVGPADVSGFAPGTVAGRFPTPGALDAETTMCPHIEFSDPGLPWRYTPTPTPAEADPKFRPWLALLVGTDDEVTGAGDLVTLSPGLLRAYPLNTAASWAHVQESGDQSIARLLSARVPLEPTTRYHAVVVPTFATGPNGLTDAWTVEQQDPVTLPAYTRWRFTTGPGGDFRTLAMLLHPAKDSAGVGLSTVNYRRRPVAPLSVGGALTAIGAPAAAEVPEAIRDDLRNLRFRPDDAAGRKVVGLPRYGDGWHEDPDATVWGAALNEDPRHRGVAGLGLRLGVELQEELAELAAEQAGALQVAAERVRHVSLGLATSAGLWRRRLPADPVRQLWLFGPALRRVSTAAGPIEAQATADDRPIPRGWFSPTVRRVLRRGPARSAMAQPAATDPAQLSPAANRPPAPVPFTETGLPSFADLQADAFEQRRVAVAGGEALVDDAKLVTLWLDLDMSRFPQTIAQMARVQSFLRDNPNRRLPWIHLSLLLAAVGTGEDDPLFDTATAEPLAGSLADAFDDLVDEPTVIPSLLADLGDRPEPPPPSRPVDLEGLAGRLARAFDPRLATTPDPAQADPPALRRVLATISGLDQARPLAPPEPCEGLDVPLWRELANREPNWLLPGVGQLDDNGVLAAATNPVFVDAFMVGFNTRLLEELRWRNLRVAAGCTPVRTFWFRANGDSGDRLDDIVGVLGWDKNSTLGDEEHRPGTAGADLVLVFRGPVFNRYPHTLVSLTSAQHDGAPDFTIPPDSGAPRTWPTFQGRIGSDVTFFGFVGVDPAAVKGLWVTLEEPPSGFRFRNDGPAPSPSEDGARFADRAFDDPTRVLIQGDLLVPAMPPEDEPPDQTPGGPL